MRTVNVPAAWRVSRTTVVAAIGLGLLATYAAGCSSGIPWRGFTFERVHEQSRRDHKLTFVYFRHWSVIACTDFEEDVLEDAAVRKATADLYCVPLDFHWDRTLADEWDVQEPPAVVILDPRRRVMASRSGAISVKELLEMIESARREFASATQPTSVP